MLVHKQAGSYQFVVRQRTIAWIKHGPDTELSSGEEIAGGTFLQRVSPVCFFVKCSLVSPR